MLPQHSTERIKKLQTGDIVREEKTNTASRAILRRLLSSNWLFGRWINLYKLPLHKFGKKYYNVKIQKRSTTGLNLFKPSRF
jgi:predicted DCC family thiol-disulfide oxidoreductase YuxK